MPISEDEFKNCMGAWPSGVTVVTSRYQDRIHGMTVSDFSGASLSPPLAVILANRESITTEMIAQGKCFGVNILAVDQQGLSNRFASKKLEHVRFEGVDYDTGETGAPLVRGAVANLDCSLHATYEAGDHLIYVGLIESVRVLPGEPLVYWNGRYCGVKSESEG
ncbi:MAG TPA: flavin reductase [Myxococcales bacterium]|nr:flavin reductase [Myxococcales bacterium]HIL02086.1 flavin reductase [Myxococcales bacterium]